MGDGATLTARKALKMPRSCLESRPEESSYLLVSTATINCDVVSRRSNDRTTAVISQCSESITDLPYEQVTQHAAPAMSGSMQNSTIPALRLHMPLCECNCPFGTGRICFSPARRLRRVLGAWCARKAGFSCGFINCSFVFNIDCRQRGSLFVE